MTPSFVLQLAGGPCAGTYSTAHGPVSLLAVRDPDGRCDVLDAPGDEPGLLEDTFRYVEMEPRSVMRVCGRGAVAGTWVTVTYQYLGTVDWRGSGEFVPIGHAESLALAAAWKLEERVRLRAEFGGPRPPAAPLPQPARGAKLSAPAVQRSLF